MMNTATTPTNQGPTLQQVLQGHTDWRDAAEEAVSYYVQKGLCFSSGEVARDLRTHRPDLRFSVLSVGEHLRDLFYAGAMPSYQDPYGGTVPVQQVSRTTAGVGRTPAGINVFVYGPDQLAGDSHQFEVDIPKPGQVPGGKAHTHPKYAGTRVTLNSGNGDGGNSVQATVTPSNQNTPSKVAKLKGKAPAKDPTATVHTDGRVCIGRPAFEAFVHLTKRPLKGGDPVYITFNGDLATVTLDAQPGSTQYDLATSRGRILFTSPRVNPFQPGKSTRISISTSGMEINMADLF